MASLSPRKSTTTAETGVEMEALVAVSVSALTIYDMLKARGQRNRDSGDCAGAQERRQERRVSARRNRTVKRFMANNVKLLVVDDNPMVLAMLQQALTPLARGHDCDRRCRRSAEGGG